MARPVLLDLFCKAGGAGMGYHRAGFDVVGVDIEPQRHYPFPVVVADAFEVPFDFWQVAAVHASPPCQDHSVLHRGRVRGTGWMLQACLDQLPLAGVPWVVENVPGRTSSQPGYVTLCGSSFGIGVRRHRRFWTSFPLSGLPCSHRDQPHPIDVTGNGRGSRQRLYDRGRNSPPVVQADRRVAMGIEWMNRNELAQAIPPAYTEHIGRQLMAHLGLSQPAVPVPED